ncbi:MAG: cupin domain-containing protein [Candidatus Methylomirabilis sp.]|nr:cupin domain-containing protein [Deltaproteobacteria bacterium]
MDEERDPKGDLKQLAIGAKVKALRTGRRWTLQRLAEKTGLSVPLLSQVENEQVSPPIATLLKIAKALDTPLAHFFQEPETPRRVTVVRAGERMPVVRRGTEDGSNLGYSYQGLAAPRARKVMEPFLVTFEHKDRSEVVFMTHEGEEFHHVLEGEIEFLTPEETVLLSAGDSLYFDAKVPHALRSVSKRKGKSLAVVTPLGGES